MGIGQEIRLTSHNAAPGAAIQVRVLLGGAHVTCCLPTRAVTSGLTQPRSH